MNTKKILTYYGIFGCWTQFVPGPLGKMLYGVWLTVVLFWIIVNAAGIFCYLMDKTNLKKEACNVISLAEIRIWHIYSLLALCSFVVCGEFYVALAFVLTSVLFMFVTEKEIKKAIEEKLTKKKSKKK
jgi:hypothetical protein